MNKSHGPFLPPAYAAAYEARVMYKEEELSPRDAALFLIDYIDTYFED